MNNAQSELILIAVVIVAALVSAVINFLRAYWQILLILTGVGLFVLFIFARSDKSSPPEYVVTEKPLDDTPCVKEYPPAGDLRVQELARVFKESSDLVASSANIETVDSRYGVMMSVGSELAAIPSPELDEFRRIFYALDAKEIFDAAAERFISRKVYEISALKTPAGRERRIAKVEELVDSLVNMPVASREYAKKLLRRNLN